MTVVPDDARHPNSSIAQHDVIQAAMGWTDSHLYEFRAGGVGWGVPDPDGYYDGPLPASKSSLLDVLEDVGTKTIHYIYTPSPAEAEFGDLTAGL